MKRAILRTRSYLGIPPAIAAICFSVLIAGYGPVETWEEKLEAEEMAIFLSGKLRAPAEMTRQIMEELRDIRATYKEEIGEDALERIQFKPRWSTDRIRIILDAEAHKLYDNGQYHQWDKLNRIYGVAKIITFGEDFNCMVLSFGHHYHPGRLAEEYIKLDGIIYASANTLSDIERSSTIYAHVEGNNSTYVFYDQMSETYSNFLIFVFNEQHKPVLVGSYNSETDDEKPDWWPDAWLIFEENFRLSLLPELLDTPGSSD